MYIHKMIYLNPERLMSPAAWLLIIPRDRQIFPFNPEGLVRGQGSRRALTRRCIDALLVDDGGQVRRIESVRVDGPLGHTPIQRLWSRLNSAWSISVELSAPLPLSLTELQDLVVECLRRNADGVSVKYTADRIDDLIRVVTSATSPAAMLQAMGLPASEDCLDMC